MTNRKPVERQTLAGIAAELADMPVNDDALEGHLSALTPLIGAPRATLRHAIVRIVLRSCNTNELIGPTVRPCVVRKERHQGRNSLHDEP